MLRHPHSEVLHEESQRVNTVGKRAISNRHARSCTECSTGLNSGGGRRASCPSRVGFHRGPVDADLAQPLANRIEGSLRPTQQRPPLSASLAVDAGQAQHVQLAQLAHNPAQTTSNFNRMFNSLSKLQFKQLPNIGGTDEGGSHPLSSNNNVYVDSDWILHVRVSMHRLEIFGTLLIQWTLEDLHLLIFLMDTPYEQLELGKYILGAISS